MKVFGFTTRDGWGFGSLLDQLLFFGQLLHVPTGDGFAVSRPDADDAGGAEAFEHACAAHGDCDAHSTCTPLTCGNAERGGRACFVIVDGPVGA